jgi:uncharacterized membrane protein (DUF485 family)
MKDDRSFQTLGARRVSFALAALVTGSYFTFVTALAIRPDWFSARVSPGDVDSPALVVTFLFLVSILAVMIGFSWWRGSR